MSYVRRALAVLPALVIVLGAACETLAADSEEPVEQGDPVAVRSGSPTHEAPRVQITEMGF